MILEVISKFVFPEFHEFCLTLEKITDCVRMKILIVSVVLK